MAVPTHMKALLARSFVQQSNQGSWVFLSLAILVTIIRTYSRWMTVGFKRFQADDYLVWFALFLYVAETVNDHMLVSEFQELSNSDMTDEQRTILGSTSEEYYLRVGGSILYLVSWPIYTNLLWSLKAAMAVFYLRLMNNLRGSRRKIHIGFGLVGVTFIIVLLVPFISCLPLTKMWQINPDPGRLCYAETSPVILWTILGCNILTDAYILWLPMPMLFQASLPKTTKIALLIIFGCGLFVTIAATLRVILTEVLPTREFHAIDSWAARETFVAIITTNLPSTFGLLRRWMKPYFAFLRTHSTTKKTRTGRGTGNGATSMSRPASIWAGGPGVGYKSSGKSANRRKSHPYYQQDDDDDDDDFENQQLKHHHHHHQKQDVESYQMKTIGSLSTPDGKSGSQECIIISSVHHNPRSVQQQQPDGDNTSLESFGGGQSSRANITATHNHNNNSNNNNSISTKMGRSRSMRMGVTTTSESSLWETGSHQQVPEGGIQKKVEISIVEERITIDSHTTGAYIPSEPDAVYQRQDLT